MDTRIGTNFCKDAEIQRLARGGFSVVKTGQEGVLVGMASDFPRPVDQQRTGQHDPVVVEQNEHQERIRVAEPEAKHFPEQPPVEFVDRYPHPPHIREDTVGVNCDYFATQHGKSLHYSPKHDFPAA
jgi:hypothetical protein